MFPSKSMIEYMTELNRLFPRNESEDPLTPLPYNSYQSPLQSAMVNRSSSSTDTTSPESYPDLYCHSMNNPRLQSTPRARAIVGRKIIGNSQTRLGSPEQTFESDYNFWLHEEPLTETPPKMTQQKNYLYELFPKENKGFEIKTPDISEAKMYDISPNFLGRSPLSNNSPFSNLSSPLSNETYRSRTFSNQSLPVSHHSPTWTNSSLGSMFPSRRHASFTLNFPNTNYLSKYESTACSSTDEIPPTKMCTFCRKNGETPSVYMTHCVKEQVRNKNIVTCPILRSHVCATCGASGDNAHTITYCPVLRSNNNGRPLQSTTITLKNTRVKSNGRRRY